MSKPIKLLFSAITISMLGACAQLMKPDSSARFQNLHQLKEDTGERVLPTYFFRRAWVQITRDLAKTEIPPSVTLDIKEMEKQPFAVAWLGHAAMLMRAGTQWILIDPALSRTAGPVQGFGPERLTRLPIPVEQLPHIDVVLISHDHYDHLDLNTMRQLAKQDGGPPRYLTGQGQREWFNTNVSVASEDFAWWQSAKSGEVNFTFVPAHHNSGRSFNNRNATLWGGWVIEHRGTRFYFAGDTAYVKQLFTDIRARIGEIHMAALPIGAYAPRPLMRFDHMNPSDAVKAHADLGAKLSFGVHWGTFQLGDEEPYEAARDLDIATRDKQSDHFYLLPIGGFTAINAEGTKGEQLISPDAYRPVFAYP